MNPAQYNPQVIYNRPDPRLYRPKQSEASINNNILIGFLKSLIEKFTKSLSTISETLGTLNDRWAAQLIPLTTYIYVDVDSTHRNRNSYPLVSDFVIPYTNGTQGTTLFNSLDPISDAL